MLPTSELRPKNVYLNVEVNHLPTANISFRITGFANQPRTAVDYQINRPQNLVGNHAWLSTELTALTTTLFQLSNKINQQKYSRPENHNLIVDVHYKQKTISVNIERNDTSQDYQVGINNPKDSIFHDDRLNHTKTYHVQSLTQAQQLWASDQAKLNTHYRYDDGSPLNSNKDQNQSTQIDFQTAKPFEITIYQVDNNNKSHLIGYGTNFDNLITFNELV